MMAGATCTRPYPSLAWQRVLSSDLQVSCCLCNVHCELFRVIRLDRQVNPSALAPWVRRKSPTIKTGSLALSFSRRRLQLLATKTLPFSLFHYQQRRLFSELQSTGQSMSARLRVHLAVPCILPPLARSAAAIQRNAVMLPPIRFAPNHRRTVSRATRYN